MSQSVQVVILCEDVQHEAFARRFLESSGLDYGRIRVNKSPKGRGSGEQYVRETYHKELEYFRARKHRVNQTLIVLLAAVEGSTPSAPILLDITVALLSSHILDIDNCFSLLIYLQVLAMAYVLRI